jgi:hypothetical protein
MRWPCPVAVVGLHELAVDDSSEHEVVRDAPGLAFNETLGSEGNGVAPIPSLRLR